MVWHRKENQGFSTIPRLLPLITALIKEKSEGDPSSVYWDLWARVFDENLVEIENEEECAFSAGYTGTRALRTWRERMYELERLGFIRIKPSGNRKFANVLLVNPLLVVANMRKASRSGISDDWWTSYKDRAERIGAVLPEATEGER
jgi:hypothetical protein